MAGGDRKWDAAADRDLCVALIVSSHEGRVVHNWSKVHAILQQLGHSFTKEAISQHFSKVVMKDFKARHGDAAALSLALAATVSDAGPSTPEPASKSSRKRKLASSSKTPTKRSLAEPRCDDDEKEMAKYDDEEYDNVGGDGSVPTPCVRKRVKNVAIDAANLIKKEREGAIVRSLRYQATNVLE
ncbi:hypothetical protein DCS_07725 [Drechmeria coniospora]|uniref:Uncharacterized protein n=1 Tax=Drechmeria coniospora TaxID=98403 RepID=A0A151GFC9_DRECN|nr:hypothetical protein DCS_07725 [Drechmeria coniospora]KYK55761.1 hypothetical protein DCS_07725 [Drechmeria coniospora]